MAPRSKFLGGAKQGYPLYPTSFNVVVYTVLRHWVVVVVAEEEAVLDIFVWAVRIMAVLVYTDGGFL